MSRMIESGLYVAVDGNWGDASGLTIIDDRDWEQSDYTLIDEASDGNKADIADAIDAWIKDGRPELFCDRDSDEFASALLDKYVRGVAQENCRHTHLYNNATREYLICFDCGAEVEVTGE